MIGLFVAGDPGSQAALSEFLDRYGNQLGHKTEYWHDARMGQRSSSGERGTPIDSNDIGTMFAELGPHYVITGASFESNLETRVWSAATQTGIPNLAWIDREGPSHTRFRNGRPAMVAAVDQAQAIDLQALGFSEEKVLIAAPVHTSDAASYLPPIRRSGRRVKMLFASEPFREDQLRDPTFSVGFDQFDALALIQRASAVVGKDIQIELTIRPHPREDRARLVRAARRLSSSPRLVTAIRTTGTPTAAAREHDIVIGMFSTFLLESLNAGAPVVSLRPRRPLNEWLNEQRRGRIITVSNVSQLVRLVGSSVDRNGLKVRARHRAFAAGQSRKPKPEAILDWIAKQISATKC